MGAVTKQTLFPPLMPAGRPFRVSNASRSSRKGIVASSLQELISKVRQTFLPGLKLVVKCRAPERQPTGFYSPESRYWGGSGEHVGSASRSMKGRALFQTLKSAAFLQTLDAFLISAGIVTLVLEEDGTVVDTEEFFRSLDDNTHFMVLEGGQKWTQVSGDCLSLE